MSAVENKYCCPVDFEPLTQAVNLIPCCHKVNESAAVHLFGSIKSNNRCSEKGKQCPVCRQVVIGYSIDYSYRVLVQNAIGSVVSAKEQIEENHYDSEFGSLSNSREERSLRRSEEPILNRVPVKQPSSIKRAKIRKKTPHHDCGACVML